MRPIANKIFLNLLPIGLLFFNLCTAQENIAQENIAQENTAQENTTQKSKAQDPESRLADFLKRYPASDLDRDGVLTRDEVRQFNTKRREQKGSSRVQDRQRPAPTVADFSYGGHDKQRFDLWAVPDAESATPLVIYIHGGGFRGGDKRAFNPATIAQYHEAGIAFASMNYRLSDVGPYPIMMEDCARGLQTIRHHARQWNIDPDRIACYGGSAGAGISLWLAFHDDLAKPDSDDPVARQSTRIVAAGTINGQSTYDMMTYREWFGVPDLPPHEALIPFYGIEKASDWQSPRVQSLMKDASAITHLSTDDEAPVYMTYNRGDVPVTRETDQGVWVHHYRLGVKLQEAMQAMGKECHVNARQQRSTKPKYPTMESFMIAKLNSTSGE